MPNPPPINTIVLSTKPQLDAIAAVLLLLLFGEKNYPGIRKAKMEFRKKLPAEKTASGLESQGILVIDLEISNFKKESSSIASQVAESLGVSKDPALARLLSFIEKNNDPATRSPDSADQAFGLAALTKDLTQEYPDNPQKIIDLVMPFLLAYYRSEKKRATAAPSKEKAIKNEEVVNAFDVFQGKKLIRVMIVKSNDPFSCDFLKNHADVKADVILQQLVSGNINIVTNPDRQVDLHDTIVMLRVSEARKKNVVLEISSLEELAKPNILAGVEEWHYDSTGNCIQNLTTSTKLSLAEIEKIIKTGLNPIVLSELCPKDHCLRESCDFFDYHLERCLPIQNKSR
ncbi:MAG: hypothetical protein COY66_04190 [Candidatus Kerfeldbacteria bacterium CG_4_10_14_0_8_um_filter_42_10]|uniref:Uncharacterized protein n=1 Tax=Candidatus Kerfeldbacteria bacterium CG_4_10_14_0_8_um_filter_42_10 TaxID=2014248 RepID=A0A2M7RIL1_9BACT|nr:MAG: hypothetical protein COY66_04190 [Candidatus Kerfeldbacteria bacterium CG_4_10_14_0_8_um_filter_42_10]